MGGHFFQKGKRDVRHPWKRIVSSFLKKVHAENEKG